MLQIKNITKQYITENFIQNALDDVSINFRDNEFVAILGPSGSGKTTFLNLIGGLDKYTDGDILINGVSTKQYKDRDWDIYRSNTIGFIFQSYNLIPHQTILQNVELALTINGKKKEDCKRIAKGALEIVGLGKHINKKPGQLSGGQMQRVAIARSIVNNPDIILADEPTGALDSETSIQVMKMLKEISQLKLVVMVTHDQELAEAYATRIIKIKDGKIISDSNPYEIENIEPKKKKSLNASMSKKTALELSWRNLKTKKTRTILTSFAGSIGVIGIALVLALSSGVKEYINNAQEDMMSSYPIVIDSTYTDLTSIFNIQNMFGANKKEFINSDAVYSNTGSLSNNEFGTPVYNNNLLAFKEWIDDKNNPIHRHIGKNGILFDYDVDFDIYSIDSNGQLITSNGINLEEKKNSFSTSFIKSQNIVNTLNNNTSNTFVKLLQSQDGLVHNSIKENYVLLYGEWPDDYNDIILILDENGEIPCQALYELGLLPAEDYNNYLNSENHTEKSIKLDFNKAISHELHLVVETDKYLLNNSSQIYEYFGDEEHIQTIVDNYSTPINICGVIQKTNTTKIAINGCVGYTQLFAEYINDRVQNSNVMIAQNKDKNYDVLSGYAFEAKTDKDKIKDIELYLSNMSDVEKSEYVKDILYQMHGNTEETRDYINGMSIHDFNKIMEQQIAAMTDDDKIKLYDEYITSGSYEDNIAKFNPIDLTNPTRISIYVDSFADKNFILKAIDEYNASSIDENKIKYSDYIMTLMKYITSIVDIITYVLIAFVAISLVVACIMIGIITNISVIERTKEIGILRAMGASKKNISQVFNAETFIIGLFSGILGIILTEILIIPVNHIVVALTKIETLNINIKFYYLIGLIVLSTLITIIGGLIPAKKAAKKDPVIALRGE